MSFDNNITCIDIGSSKIRTIIWNVDNETNTLSIVWIWISDSNAIRKWNILDMEEFKSNLDKSVEEAEKMAGEHVTWAFISFNTSSFEVVDNRWIIAISWEEIGNADIERVLDMAKSGVSLPNKEILKVIPDTFTVDLEEWIKSPVWMSARKLEVKASIFSINSNILNNIKKAIADLGIEIYDVFPNLISAPEGILTKRQKELWVVCIDIWASTTWITVYEEWTLKYSQIIPIGWDSVTNDVALWVRTSIDTAERLKLDHWQINLEKFENYTDITIDLSKISAWEDGETSKLYLSKIITARYEEILYFVKDALKRIWRDWMLPEWAVFVWEAVKMKWFLELSKEILRLPATIWIPCANSVIWDSTLWDPSFTSVIWSLYLANKFRNGKSVMSFNVKWFFGSIFGSIMKVIKKILP